MSLPNANRKLHVFTIDFPSEIDDKQYQGQFTCRKRSMMDMSRISVRRSQLCGGMYCVRDDDGKPTGQGISEEIEYTNHMLAELEVLLVQKPEWFNLDEIGDNELVQKVYGEVAKFQATFRNGGATAGGEGQPVQGGEVDGSAKPAQGVGGNPPPTVVDKKVPPSLDA